MADTTLYPSILPDSDDSSDPLTSDDPAPETVTPADLEDADGCPLCEDYAGEHVLQHARNAHPSQVVDDAED